MCHCPNTDRRHCIFILCFIVLICFVLLCYSLQQRLHLPNFCNNLGEYGLTNSMTDWIRCSTKDILMEKKMIIHFQFPDKYSRPHNQNGQDLANTVVKNWVVSHCYLKKKIKNQIPEQAVVFCILINFCQTQFLEIDLPIILTSYIKCVLLCLLASLWLRHPLQCVCRLPGSM